MTDLQINNAFFAALFASGAIVGVSMVSELAFAQTFSVGTAAHQFLTNVMVYL